MVSRDPFLSYATPAVFAFMRQYSKTAKVKDMSAMVYSGAKFRQDINITMEEDTFIGTNAVILVPKLTMKKGSQINAGAILSGRNEIILEENVVVGYGAILLTSTNMPKGKFMNDASPESKRVGRQGPIILKKNSFIGSQTLIMPDVTVEEGVVVMAKSYVDKNLKTPKGVYKNNTLQYLRE